MSELKMSVSIDSQVNAHIHNAAPMVAVYNNEKSEYSPANSFMCVEYKKDSGSKVTLFLDHAAAKALAEGIAGKLEEMKFRGE